MSRVVLVFVLGLALSLSTTPSRADWQFESNNDRSGISSFATSFWAQGYGPVSWQRLMNLGMDDGDLWGTLTVSCIRKKLYVSIGVRQAGSGNDEIRLDDPGYVSIAVSSGNSKRYRTEGSEYKDTFFLRPTDSKLLVRSMLGKNYLVVTPRFKLSNQRVRMLFEITGLSKGKTRFKYAGCPF